MAEYSEEDIRKIADALKQVIAVHPTLLFEATKTAHADWFIEAMGIALQDEKNKKVDILKYRMWLTMEMGRLIFQSGRAEVTQRMVNDIAMYVNFINHT